ncbi:GMC family oxidoreductase N-terminal domain-containing protein [Leucobacter sp. CSA2]|uniref:GMC family oxidoreductase N-terminal domain-containing protein n=1 Tax=Leucobacter edaphi TaxID=2796472 RepID=A0A934QD99_9MICO|nr:GMC family oxidoreductase N-terminal domain-containing protein [Leucobacter edaphi]MBK0422504.1 GMC family oxidoreductase N-terminal domain-containing protein [Leucobacter edaphi]
MSEQHSESTPAVPRTAIVIGAGSAGSVVTRRLADAGVDVTVLEAGGEDTNPAIHDLSRMGELWHSEDDWDYFTVPLAGANGHRMHLPRGKVLGGSHALNAMIWVRCAPQDFDHWASLGNDGWSWNDVLPVYKSIENYSGAGDPALHGTSGLLDVTDDYELSPIQQSIIDAAVEEGLEHNPDYNGASIEGVSQQQITVRGGERLNTYMAYLKPVRDRVDVRVGCRVLELIFAGESGAEAGDGAGAGSASGAGAGGSRRPRVVGVRYTRGGETHEAFADEVILAAGAIDSPRVLLRSGIGPAEELREVGIEPVVDLPGVGKNLHDHYLAPVIFDTEQPIDPPREGVSVTQSHLFWKSRPGLDRPDTQPIHFSVPMYGDFLEPRGANGFSLMAGLITPQARGEIRLSGPGADDPLLIDPDALGHDEDVASLVASVRQCRRIGSQASLAAAPEDGGWGATEVYPGASVGDGEDLVDYVRNTLATYHHQVGTCKMGTDDLAVVSPRLAVHGVDGLRVIDASIMPRITTGNTNAPAILIGELGARFVLAGER